MAERTESIILDFEVDIEDSIESIDSLTKANKELRKERNALNIQSETGKKRAAEINAVLDENTNKIKNNISALERQKVNIGNYSSALDRVIPGLSGFIEKGASATKTVQGLTLAQKLLLGPIGLLIIALTAIVKWLTGSEEGMDKLAIVMAKVSAVVNVVTDRLIQLGGALVKFLSGDFSGGIDGIKNSFAGMGDEMQREIDLAVDLAERLDILDDLNLSLRIRLAEQENVIKNLIIQSRNRFIQEEKAMELLIEASRLEKQLTGERIALRLAEINAIASGIQMRNNEKQAAQQAGETTIEFAKRIANDNRILLSDREKIAEQLEQYNTLLDNQANIQEKIQNQQDAIADKIAENLREAQALADANRRAQNIPEGATRDPLLGAFQTQLDNRLQIQRNFDDRLTKQQREAELERIRNANRSAKAQAEIEKNLQETKLNTISGFLGVAASLFERESEEYKAFATFQTLISTYSTAQKAYEAAFVPPTVASPALGALNVALAIATGLANLAAIHGVQFADGGWTGPGDRMKPVGVVHADEYVAPKWIVNSPMAQPHLAALESMRVRGYQDGGLVSNSITQPINQQMEIMNIVKNLPPVVASWSEGRKVGRRLEFKEQISKR